METKVSLLCSRQSVTDDSCKVCDNGWLIIETLQWTMSITRGIFNVHNVFGSWLYSYLQLTGCHYTNIYFPYCWWQQSASSSALTNYYATTQTTRTPPPHTKKSIMSTIHAKMAVQPNSQNTVYIRYTSHNVQHRFSIVWHCSLLWST